MTSSVQLLEPEHSGSLLLSWRGYSLPRTYPNLAFCPDLASSLRRQRIKFPNLKCFYFRQDWCQFQDPLNRAWSDCIECFSLLRHLNSTKPHYWTNFLDTIAVYNYRDCHGPHCIIPGTIVPPSFSEKLHQEIVREWEERQREREKSRSSGGRLHRSQFNLLVNCLIFIVLVTIL